MGWLTGFEPAHDGITIHCLNRLTTATTTVAEALTSWVPLVKSCLLAGLLEFRHETLTHLSGHRQTIASCNVESGVSCPRRMLPEGVSDGLYCANWLFSRKVTDS